MDMDLSMDTASAQHRNIGRGGFTAEDGRPDNCASRCQKVMLHDLWGASGQMWAFTQERLWLMMMVYRSFGCLLGWVKDIPLL